MGLKEHFGKKVNLNFWQLTLLALICYCIGFYLGYIS